MIASRFILSGLSAAFVIAPAYGQPVNRPPAPTVCTLGADAAAEKAKRLLASKQANEAFLVMTSCRDKLGTKEQKDLYRQTLLAAQKEDREKERQAKIAKRKQGVSVGMSQQDVLDSSWGRPERINQTVTGRGIREQWVYPGAQYLYFEDGVLTSIHSRR